MSAAYRSDIQGLRAIAILPVVAFHYFPTSLPGGFTGVDIFFVISGYLITQSLISNMEASAFGLIKGFYKRRIRRLFPALSLVFLATSLAGLFVLFPDDLVEFARSQIAAMLFVSNLYFMRTGDYFSANSDLFPLLHTWSLSVEEQFYIVYPLLVFLALRYGQRYFFALLVLATLALFALSEAIVWLKPAAGYYFTGSRAFELAIGCCLAACPRRFYPTGWTAQALAVAGVLAMATGFVVLDEETHFPGAGALLPCLGSAALIFSGMQVSTWMGRVLATPPALFFGNISYSFYLWHWPPLALLRYYYGLDLDAGVLVAGMLASLLAAWLSYRYVEQPFLARSAAGLPYFRMAMVVIGLFVALSVAIIAQKGFPGRFSAAVNAQLASAKDINPMRDKCHMDEGPEHQYADVCRFADDPAKTKPIVAVWGDSHGAELAYALGQSSLVRTHAIAEVTSSGCPPALGFTPSARRGCASQNERMLAGMLHDPRIDTVVVSIYIQAAAYKSPTQTGLLHSGLARSIHALRAGGKKVILVLPIPTYDTEPPLILAKAVQRSQPLTDLGMTRAQFDHSLGSAVEFEKALAKREGAQYYDPRPLFCDADHCQLHRPGVGALYFNPAHASLSAARVMANDIAAMIGRGGDKSAP